MKNILLIFAILFACSAASAQISSPIQTPALGFSPAVVAHLQQTAFVMDDNANQSFCTAFPITSDGYMLTALHCVRGCLISQGLAQEALNHFIGLDDVTVIKNPTQSSVCSNLAIKALGVTSVQVVATSNGLSTFEVDFTDTYQSLYDELKSHGYTSRANDFAVIKVQTAQPLSCLHINSQPTAPGTKLFVVGFPQSSGATPVLSASVGQLYSQPSQSAYYSSETTPAEQNWVRLQYFDEGVLYSNAAPDFGQSGGPVITQDGSVNGIQSGFTSLIHADNSETHEAVATSTAHVLKNLPANLAAVLEQKNSACH